MAHQFLPSRRAVLRAIAGAGCLLARNSKAKAATPVDALVSQAAFEGQEPECLVRRRYKAHAQVRFLSIPIFSRQDVGGAFAELAEYRSGDRSLVTLKFAAGSDPARTSGLNRAGCIEEAVLTESGICTHAAYFGFMAASKEQSLDQARASLRAPAGHSMPYAAAAGDGQNGKFHCILRHVSMPSRLNWTSFNEMDGEVRKLFSGSVETDAGTRESTLDANPETFLFSILRAVTSNETKAERAIVYNGKRYRLKTQKQLEQRANHRSWRLAGSITEDGHSDGSPFQVWFDADGENLLPTRIEFSPKSYLRLVFEQEPVSPKPGTIPARSPFSLAHSLR